eukprot:1298738-Prymnesium_polylepis.1
MAPPRGKMTTRNGPRSWDDCPVLRAWENCTSATPDAGRWAAALLERLQNRTVVLVGDSVQAQLYVALVCALHASVSAASRGVRIVENRTTWFRYGGPIRKRCWCYTPLLWKQCRCHWTSSQVAFSNGARLQFCDISPAPASWLKLGDRVRGCLEQFGGGAHLVVYGTVMLHWMGIHHDGAAHRRSEVAGIPPGSAGWPLAAAAEVYQVLVAMNRSYCTRSPSSSQSLPTLPRLIWREVTAQHFDAPGGWFQVDNYEQMRRIGQINRSRTCVRHRATMPTPFGNSASLKRAGVPVIPAWHITEGAFDSH